MAKITLFYAAVHALLMMVLAANVVFHRRASKIGIGDGGDHRLLRKIRAHANFVEYVPVALILLALLELSGAQALWLWIFGGVLLLGRLLHAFGLSRKSGYSPGRFFGTLLTWIALAAMALLGLGIALGAM
jgi:uncharacterized membrane protein YecN with MAPEG domain